jgi:A118 family predicted phage portal protein
MLPTANTDLSKLIGEVWFNRLQEWRVWYSGDTLQLKSFYQADQSASFWKRIANSQTKYGLHIPLAGDIASTSSDLLFSEIPEITFDNNPKGQERVEYFINESGFQNRLIEASEICAALGGVLLKLDTDPQLTDIPILSIVAPTQAILVFKRNRLWEVTTFRVVRMEDNNNTIYRLFEERKRISGGITVTYRLYKGDATRTGTPVGLESIDETKRLNLKPVTYEIDGLGIVYVPNILPNRLDLNLQQGISDYSGVVPLMDALDETWTSLMREIRLAKSTIFVDEELLEGGKLDLDQEAYVKLKISDMRLQKDAYKPIDHIQPELRIEEYLKAATELTADIISRSGYAPQTFGFRVEGRAETGTALRIRERKSLMTRGKKSRYWHDAIGWLLYDMQRLDIASGLQQRYEPAEVTVTMQDSITPEPREEAETIRALKQAEAMSIETSVRRINPDWSDDKILEEVNRIKMEKGSMVDDILAERI